MSINPRCTSVWPDSGLFLQMFQRKRGLFVSAAWVGVKRSSVCAVNMIELKESCCILNWFIVHVVRNKTGRNAEINQSVETIKHVSPLQIFTTLEVTKSSGGSIIQSGC